MRHQVYETSRELCDTRRVQKEIHEFNSIWSLCCHTLHNGKFLCDPWRTERKPWNRQRNKSVCSLPWRDQWKGQEERRRKGAEEGRAVDIHQTGTLCYACFPHPGSCPTISRVHEPSSVLCRTPVLGPQGGSSLPSISSLLFLCWQLKMWSLWAGKQAAQELGEL